LERKPGSNLAEGIRVQGSTTFNSGKKREERETGGVTTSAYHLPEEGEEKERFLSNLEEKEEKEQEGKED